MKRLRASSTSASSTPVERPRPSRASVSGCGSGEIDADPRLEAERLLVNLVENPHDAGVLILVAPGARRVEIMTTPTARRRITDQAAGLVVLAMTSSFAVGDLVGGMVNAFRQLADAAGRPAEADINADYLTQIEPAAR